MGYICMNCLISSLLLVLSCSFLPPQQPTNCRVHGRMPTWVKSRWSRPTKSPVSWVPGRKRRRWRWSWREGRRDGKRTAVEQLIGLVDSTSLHAIFLSIYIGWLVLDKSSCYYLTSCLSSWHPPADENERLTGGEARKKAGYVLYEREPGIAPLLLSLVSSLDLDVRWMYISTEYTCCTFHIPFFPSDNTGGKSEI